MSRPKTKVICTYCKKTFLKENRGIAASIRKGSAHMCSLLCAGRYAAKITYGDAKGFGFYSGNCRKIAKRKKLECNVTTEYLRDLFKKQKGKCALTSIPMIMNRSRASKAEKSIYYASVDRLDNSKGYIQGNVQFVCLGINYMRNNFSIEEAIGLINRIREDNSTK